MTLLSDEEVKTYLGEGESAKAKDTQYAYDNKDTWAFDGRWYLRSSYEGGKSAALRYTHCIDVNGKIDWYGPQDSEFGIRPAMWVSIS